MYFDLPQLYNFKIGHIQCTSEDKYNFWKACCVQTALCALLIHHRNSSFLVKAWNYTATKNILIRWWLFQSHSVIISYLISFTYCVRPHNFSAMDFLRVKIVFLHVLHRDVYVLYPIFLQSVFHSNPVLFHLDVYLGKPVHTEIFSACFSS